MKSAILPLLLTAAVMIPAAPQASAHSGGGPEPAPIVSGMPDPSLHFASGGVYVIEESSAENNTLVQRRSYELYNGDQVKMGRVEASAALDFLTAAEMDLPASGGIVRWFDPASGNWQSAPLSSCSIRASCVVVTLDNGGETLFYTPKVYKPLGGGTLQHLPELDGSLDLRQTADGWSVQLTAPSLPAGCEASYTLVSSPERLFSGQKVLDNFWYLYTLDGEGKWCFDGYYFPSPDSYTPSGENCYYRLPAAYLCKSFAGGAPVVRAAGDLAAATLDVMSRQQNQYGYFPTLPVSQWLANDYGIGAGFYDTRFNTDLIEVYLKFSKHNPCVEFDAVLNRYFDFFLGFAASNHRETENGGWLVDDYWHPEGGNGVHTSLNHQLAEILALHHAAGYLERDDLRVLAGQMLQAIEDTAGNWIRSDSNLHYAAYRDGTYGGQDYPYLTYNDLYSLKAYLGHSTPGLDRLMNAKRAWMDANGVTEYKK